MAELPHSVINEKVLRFEAFINDVLKEDLRKIHLRYDCKTSEMAEWIQLKNTIQNLQDEKVKSFKAKMDIGSSIFAQVFIPDSSNILINVGAGVYVDYSLEEALHVIDFRIKLLEKEMDALKDASYTIKARIKLVLHGIEELQGIK